MSAIRCTPLADLRQGHHVSVSQLKAGLTCPNKYEVQYVVEAEPGHRPVSLAFGTTVHRALEASYDGLEQGRRPTTEEIQVAFVHRWAVKVRNPLPLPFDEDHEAECHVQDRDVRVVPVSCRWYGLTDLQRDGPRSSRSQSSRLSSDSVSRF